MGVTPRRARSQPPAARPPSLEVQIDEVIVDGVSPADREALGAALSRELSRLATDPATAGRLGARPIDSPRLDAGVLDTPPGAPAEAVAEATARAIWRGIGGGGAAG